MDHRVPQAQPGLLKKKTKTIVLLKIIAQHYSYQPAAGPKCELSVSVQIKQDTSSVDMVPVDMEIELVPLLPWP